jgi:hypothetical protein
MSSKASFKSSPAHHWSQFFLEIRHQFCTSILISNWILINQQTSICNPGSDAYFEYTSCYFKVLPLFIRNLFRVRLPYLLLIRSHWPNMLTAYDNVYDNSFLIERIRKTSRKLSQRIINKIQKCAAYFPVEALLKFPYKTRVCCKRRSSTITRYILILGTLYSLKVSIILLQSKFYSTSKWLKLWTGQNCNFW